MHLWRLPIVLVAGVVGRRGELDRRRRDADHVPDPRVDGLNPIVANADLGHPVATRYITLNEIDPDEATWFLNLNGVHFDEGPVTETPRVGTVEDWVYINLTADTHPMHTHLVTFQVIGRTPFDVEAYEEAHEGPHGVPGGIDPTPFATRPTIPPAPEERGFKDTVKANPGQFTTIRAKFELPAGGDGTPGLRVPLPHRGARGQRHDAAVYRDDLISSSPGAAREAVDSTRHSALGQALTAMSLSAPSDSGKCWRSARRAVP